MAVQPPGSDRTFADFPVIELDQIWLDREGWAAIEGREYELTGLIREAPSGNRCSVDLGERFAIAPSSKPAYLFVYRRLQQSRRVTPSESSGWSDVQVRDLGVMLVGVVAPEHWREK